MVFFTCTHCGEALKKPQVEKHFQFQCRNSISVSCMDCFKDFWGQEYVAHTKCISEAERYGGKDFVARPSKNKGERKQQDWITVVQSVIETCQNLSNAEKNILNILSSHENVPRKKAKFFNFTKSVFAGKVNEVVVESVWEKMEEAFKKASQNKSDGDCKSPVQRTKLLNRTDISENENNENLSKEYEKMDSNTNQILKFENRENIAAIPELADEGSKHKSMRPKAREMLENPATQVESGLNSKRKAVEILAKNSTQSVEIKLNRRTKIPKVDNESETSHIPNANVLATKFDWNHAILKIVRSKGEVSLKKLRKKVLEDYQASTNKIMANDKAVSKFDKKMKKISQIVVTDRKVKFVA